MVWSQVAVRVAGAFSVPTVRELPEKSMSSTLDSNGRAPCSLATWPVWPICCGEAHRLTLSPVFLISTLGEEGPLCMRLSENPWLCAIAGAVATSTIASIATTSINFLILLHPFPLRYLGPVYFTLMSQGGPCVGALPATDYFR